MNDPSDTGPYSSGFGFRDAHEMDWDTPIEIRATMPTFNRVSGSGGVVTSDEEAMQKWLAWAEGQSRKVNKSRRNSSHHRGSHHSHNNEGRESPPPHGHGGHQRSLSHQSRKSRLESASQTAAGADVPVMSPPSSHRASFQGEDVASPPRVSVESGREERHHHKHQHHHHGHHPASSSHRTERSSNHGDLVTNNARLAGEILRPADGRRRSSHYRRTAH
jgi:hypothetical protein